MGILYNSQQYSHSIHDSFTSETIYIALAIPLANKQERKISNQLTHILLEFHLSEVV